jgi:hypothetical protein
MNYHSKSADEEPMSTTMLCKVTASHIKLVPKHLYKSMAMCGRHSLLEQLVKKWVSMQVSNIPSTVRQLVTDEAVALENLTTG